MAKKRRKNGCFGVFRHYFRKTLRKFAVFLRLSSNLQDTALLIVKVAQIIKWTILIGEKIKFWAKRRRKKGFFGVFRYYFKETLRKFAALLRLSSNLQDSRLFDYKNCANNKMDNFNWRKI